MVLNEGNSSKSNGAEGHPETPGRGSPWTFLTNHAHVLVCLARDPRIRLREVALEVGITERAVQKIVGELEDAGVVTRDREGRRNHYAIHLDRPLRHPLESHRTIGDLLALILDRAEQQRLEDASRGV